MRNAAAVVGTAAWMLAATCLVALPGAGCLPAPSPNSDGNHGNGNGNGNVPFGDDGGTSCVDPGSCPSGGGSGDGGTGGPGGSSCGQQTVPLTSSQVAPNVFFVIDRSGSMHEQADSSSSTTKWDGLKSALGMVLDQNTGKAQWGLSLFPSGTDDQSCATGVIDVPIAAGDEAAIKAKVNSFSSSDVDNLNGQTPTAGAIQAVTAENVLIDPTRENYVVLMTDGQPNCGTANDVTPAIQALYAQTPSVKTFVIGFGAGTNGGAASFLNEWAVAGHTDQAGATKYYQANSVAALQTAFQAIVAGVASCTYKLTSPPADPSLVAPYIDGQPVLMSATNGFTYDPSTQSVTFTGTVCDEIKSGAVMKVTFVYGCPPSPVL